MVLAHAIQATVAESRGLPGASARERFKELVLNALAAEKLALKEIAHEPESIAEPAANRRFPEGVQKASNWRGLQATEELLQAPERRNYSAPFLFASGIL